CSRGHPARHTGGPRDNPPCDARLGLRPCSRYDKCAPAGLREVPPNTHGTSMPKTPPGRRPDPMAREVDRLLTRLAQIGPQAQRNGAAHATTPVGVKVTPTQFVGVASSPEPTRNQLLALWARVLLGATLGVVMTQWPYPHSCDLPLLGYLGAVTMVILAGSWLAFASWRLRSGPAHILSLIL